ncbi:MAG: dihydroxyacetone kinase phosphoryl donor subunit DhaM [Thermoproteus sp.]
MVGIIIFSHSKKLAEGLLEIINQMTKGSVKIEAVGGTSDASLGSDPLGLRVAIDKLASEDMILIFCDFGSTVLAAKSVIKMLPKELASRVVIADAPIVEGAFVAAVEVSAGSTPTEVLKAIKDVCNYHKI